MKDFVKGVPKIKLDHDGVCNGCGLRKDVKGRCTSSDSRSKGILDLVHSDVCGPMSDKTLGGSLYYVSFIADYSCQTWIYILKSKDQVFEKFCEFKAQVENATGRKINTLRFDNGGEYASKELIAFCRDARIKRELIVPYYPQQNGTTKRKKKTIMEPAKAMLHDQELPMFLWGEVSRTTVYVQNRCPH